MGWDDAQATQEYSWLQLMSSVKYDDYSDFRAGSRFLESLVTWLRQFPETDRSSAYSFVKDRLVYISEAEMQRLIEMFLPEIVTPYLRKRAAVELNIQPYQVWGDPKGMQEFNRLLRRCLFIGLSDGSRVDILRRSNSGRLVQDQVVPILDIGHEKWFDLREKLQNEQGDQVRFEDVYLIDDFTASGTTFVRLVDGEWKGKLKKFNDIVCNARAELKDAFPIAENCTLHIHHHVSAHQAHLALNDRVRSAFSKWKNSSFSEFVITEGMLLPRDLKMTPTTDANMLSLCDKYYDDQLYQRLKKHCDEAGQNHMRHGYACCALPLVFEHNTPNNTISLVWAETNGQCGHAMRPLFRRRDRHG